MTKGSVKKVPIAWLFISFWAGAAAMWVLMTFSLSRPLVEAEVLKPDATEPVAAPPTTIAPAPRQRLRPDERSVRRPATANIPVAKTGVAAKILRVPIDGIDVESFKGGFIERRGNHPHEAVDILAPRNTAVHAVVDGTIAKLFVSKAGGNTIYQFDSSGQLCYYYAHLERYAGGLHEGQAVEQGDVIGYVGTSGNAPPNTPHLHFAVFKLGRDRRWWQGEAVDPYEVFRK